MDHITNKNWSSAYLQDSSSENRMLGEVSLDVKLIEEAPDNFVISSTSDPPPPKTFLRCFQKHTIHHVFRFSNESRRH